MRSIYVLFVLLSGAQAATQIPTFISLFNGKDLTGWVDVNTSKDTWYVKDGLLVYRTSDRGDAQ